MTRNNLIAAAMTSLPQPIQAAKLVQPNQDFVPPVSPDNHEMKQVIKQITRTDFYENQIIYEHSTPPKTAIYGKVYHHH